MHRDVIGSSGVSPEISQLFGDVSELCSPVILTGHVSDCMSYLFLQNTKSG